MKKLLFISSSVFLISVLPVAAQKKVKPSTSGTEKTQAAKEDKSQRPSPPAIASVTTAFGNTITINYSQPAVKGRVIGKEIAPYGEIWRTGANEATSITISKPALINGKNVAAGKYALFTIPGEKKWTFILNKNWNQWGAYSYDAQQDVARFEIEPQTNPEFMERLTFSINKEGRTLLLWGNIQLDFIIQ